MALSKEAKERLIIALTSKKVGKEVADAIDAGANQAFPVAAAVAEIADPTTADAEECANKINEIIQELQAAGLMA